MPDMTCPTCRRALTVSHGTRETRGAIWVCGRCKGAAANLAVLRKRLKPGLVTDLWRTMLSQGAPAYRPCPVCHDAMSSFTAPLDTAEITLDLCKKCQIIWFDGGELEAMPKAPPQVADIPPEVKCDVAMIEAHRNYELERLSDGEPGQDNRWADIAALVLRLVLALVLKR
jgi:Zn-finger nucleic acid-binding protein